MRIFIIGGKANSGKSLLANMIKDYYKNERTVITEYSKYIKLMAHEMMGWDYISPKPRRFLQDIGLDVRNKFGEDYFVNRMIDDIKVYQEYFDNVIICDARFINEIDVMKKRYPESITIHLINDNDSKISDEEKHHISELELEKYNDFDYTINNTNLNMQEEITKILEELK